MPVGKTSGKLDHPDFQKLKHRLCRPYNYQSTLKYGIIRLIIECKW